jgi:hypothetical protein
MKLLVSHMIDLNNGGKKGLGTAKLLCNADKIAVLKAEKNKKEND